MEPTKKFTGTIGFIGGGNMCYAICCGMIQKGEINPSQLFVSGPTPKNLEKFKALGINVTTNNGEVATKVDVIVLSVKPYMLSVIVEDLNIIKKNHSNKLLISVLAGISLESLKNAFENFKSIQIVRAMPNTPLMVGAGVTAYSFDSNEPNVNTDSNKNIIDMIFGCSGITVEVPEKYIDAVVGVSGSGPAYVFLMIEALADGGVKSGLPRELAQKLAAHTMIGAGKMVLETGKHPGELKDMVCSPSGTTIAAVHALERNGIRAALIEAVETSAKRSIEMGLERK